VAGGPFDSEISYLLSYGSTIGASVSGTVLLLIGALNLLVLLEVVGVILQASALKAPTLTFSDKLGYSFLQNMNSATVGLELVTAVVLAVAPVVARQRTTGSQDAVAQIVIVAAAALARVIMIGGIIGVPARTHILHLSHQKVTAAIRWVLFTFVIRCVGTAAVALAAAVAAVRVRFAPRVAPPVTPAP
jgi:hypothetical protein